MSLRRRGLLALALASVVAAAVRLRGSPSVQPQSGGWRELSGADFK
jgi:hypothetical protein